MQATAIWGLVKTFGPYVLLAILAGALWWTRADLKATRVERDRAKAEVTLLKVDAAAKEKAAQERVVETAAVAANERKLVDAIQSVPDTAPDPVRVALGCQRLRGQGTADAVLPAVCRPGERSEAPRQP